MGIITQDTAADIFNAHRNIIAGKKLIEDMEKVIGDRDLTQLARDAFGRKRLIQMGVPSGDSAHQLFDVSPKLAIAIIRAHIAEKEAELAAICERVAVELAAPASSR